MHLLCVINSEIAGPIWSNGKHLIGGIQLDGGPGHAPDDTALFILGNRLPTGILQRFHARGAVASHARQQHGDARRHAGALPANQRTHPPTGDGRVRPVHGRTGRHPRTSAPDDPAYRRRQWFPITGGCPGSICRDWQFRFMRQPFDQSRHEQFVEMLNDHDRIVQGRRKSASTVASACGPPVDAPIASNGGDVAGRLPGGDARRVG